MLRPAILTCVLAVCAAADAPLPPPSDHTVFSPDRRCHAFLDARSLRTTVFRRGNPNVKLWDMPGWFRVASLSDDCDHLVTGFDGINLVPLNYQPDLVLLRFFDRGKLVREVKLSELIPDLSRLRRTASHYHWGQYIGFVGRNRYAVDTVSAGRIYFDALTGLRN